MDQNQGFGENRGHGGQHFNKRNRGHNNYHKKQHYDDKPGKKMSQKQQYSRLGAEINALFHSQYNLSDPINFNDKNHVNAIGEQLYKDSFLVDPWKNLQ